MKAKTWIGTFLLLALVGAASYGAYAAGWFEGATDPTLKGVVVQRGRLRISVLESGNLKAARSVELKSELEGSSTILFLAAEGSQVAPGDLLVELDATNLIDQRVSQEISVQNAEGAYIEAEQNLAIQKSQNQSDIAAAERQLDFAHQDRRKYVEGDFPQARRVAEDEILLSQEELARAEDKLRWSTDLEAQGFLTRTELEADALAKKRAEIKLAQTIREKELLEEYDYPRQLKALDADVEEAARELERTNLQAAARLVDYEASLRTSEAKLELEREKLRKIERQIEKSKIYSPLAGLVVYAVEDGGWRGSAEPIAEGTAVRERQGIITIPSSEGMIAQASLHESVVEQVSVGQRVIVRVDALPGREFSGVVKFKAVLPDQNTRWANPNLRVYRTEIEIQNPVAEMRPGMSCSVEVLVADLENAIHVPVQAIFLRGGETVAFVDGAEGIEVRPVHVGRHNTAWVEIVEGLEEGELVLLSQPGGFELDAALEDEEEEPLTPAAEGAPGPASLPPGLPGGMPGGREGGDRGTFPGSAPGNGGRSGAEGSSRGRGDGEGAAAVERGSDSAERGSSPEDGPRGGRSGGEAAAGERAPSGGAEESRAERPR